MLNAEFDRDEVNALITVVNAWGVNYLLGGVPDMRYVDGKVDPVSLIQRLAACNYPLVENACISLFILHPELASSVVEAIERSEQDIAENIVIVTLATLYMQQWWIFRLTFALGRLPDFPEAPFQSLWEQRNLPPPQQGYGLHGLIALEEYQQKRYGIPINFREDWQNQINHLINQEEKKNHPLPDSVQEALIQLKFK